MGLANSLLLLQLLLIFEGSGGRLIRVLRCVEVAFAVSIAESAACTDIITIRVTN